jgi:hypothetical protein
MHAGFAERYSRSQMDRIMEAYSDWVSRLVAAGFQPYFLTFLGKNWPGGKRTAEGRLAKEVERVWRILLTRIIRRPHEVGLTELPLLIGCPDLPVPKTAQKRTTPLQYIVTNEGLHYHAVILIPPNSRMRVGLGVFIEEKQLIFASTNSQLIRVHCEPITDDPSYVVRYALKAIETLRLDYADVLILPKTSSEVLCEDGKQATFRFRARRK